MPSGLDGFFIVTAPIHRRQPALWNWIIVSISFPGSKQLQIWMYFAPYLKHSFREKNKSDYNRIGGVLLFRFCL
jgi:hypothetical protein